MNRWVKDAIALDRRIARERTESIELIPGYFANRTVEHPVREMMSPPINPEFHVEFRVPCECLEALRTVQSTDIPATVMEKIEPVLMVGHDFGLSHHDPDHRRFLHLHRIYVGQCPHCHTIWWQECQVHGPWSYLF